MFNLKKELYEYKPYDKNEDEDLKEFLKFIESNDNPFDRKNFLAHVTSGALICDYNGHILLNHHKFSLSWCQFGGHVEEGYDVFENAKKEVFEECGIKDFLFCEPKIFNIAIYDVPKNEVKRELKHKHFDINFLFITNNKNYKQSNESLDIKWFTIEDAIKIIDEKDKPLLRMVKKYKMLLSNYNKINFKKL